MRLKLFSIYFSVLLLPACNNNKSRSVSEISYEYDTLSIPRNIQLLGLNDSCSVVIRSYYQRFGIIISKYYLIEDYLPLKLNDDSIVDTLVVFSPISLEQSFYKDCPPELMPRRIVVEIASVNAKSKIINIYSNIISSEGGITNKYNGINISDGGFEIEHQAGSKYSWKYLMQFNLGYSTKISLNKITKICSIDAIDKIVIIDYKNYPIDMINIDDTIASNCNCDAQWEQIEKTIK